MLNALRSIVLFVLFAAASASAANIKPFAREEMATAQTKIKAPVVSRLKIGPQCNAFRKDVERRATDGAPQKIMEKSPFIGSHCRAKRFFQSLGGPPRRRRRG